MTISTIKEIAARIKTAPPESPIALFSCNTPGHLEAVFASTIRTREMISCAKNGGKFIGIYHGAMDQFACLLDYSRFVK